MRILFLSIVLTLFGIGAMADDDGGTLTVSNDVFAAANEVDLNRDGADDVFLMGQNITATADITGSAHIMGRRIVAGGDIGGSLYAMGMEIDATGDVAGDATVTGYEIRLGDVGGDVRAMGSEVTLTGAVGGYALVAGETVTLDGPVAGDLLLTAGEVRFGDNATVAGQLIVYEDDPGALDIPASVAPADRVERREIERWEGDTRSYRPGWGHWLGSFVMGIVIMAALAALVASVIPDHLAAMRRRVLDAPFKSIWMGFLALSLLIGSGIVLAMTIIGIFVMPVAFIAAAIAGFAGYVVGVYALGVGLMLAIGRPDPARILDKVIAAAVGAVAAGLIALIPLIGWLVVLALVLAGLGVITIRLFRPVFFAPVNGAG